MISKLKRRQRLNYLEWKSCCEGNEAGGRKREKHYPWALSPPLRTRFSHFFSMPVSLFKGSITKRPNTFCWSSFLLLQLLYGQTGKSFFFFFWNWMSSCFLYNIYYINSIYKWKGSCLQLRGTQKPTLTHEHTSTSLFKKCVSYFMKDKPFRFSQIKPPMNLLKRDTITK